MRGYPKTTEFRQDEGGGGPPAGTEFGDVMGPDLLEVGGV